MLTTGAVFAVSMACVTVPIKVAARMRAEVHARPIADCDVAASACMVALTLSNASEFELPSSIDVQFVVPRLADRRQPHMLTLNASLSDESGPSKAPVVLADGKRKYVQLRLNKTVNCPAAMQAALSGFPTERIEVGLLFGGQLLAPDGQARQKFIHAQLDDVLPGSWRLLAGSLCETWH